MRAGDFPNEGSESSDSGFGGQPDPHEINAYQAEHGFREDIAVGEPLDEEESDGSGDADAAGYDRMIAAREDLRVLVSALDGMARQLAGMSYLLQRQLSEKSNTLELLDPGERRTLRSRLILRYRWLRRFCG